MKRLLLVCAVFPLLVSAAFPGAWMAKTQAVSAATHKPETIAIYVTLSSGSGGVTGTAAATGGVFVPIQNVAVSGSQITFSIAESGGKTSFALTDLGTSLQGNVTLSDGQILPVTFATVR